MSRRRSTKGWVVLAGLALGSFPLAAPASGQGGTGQRSDIDVGTIGLQQLVALQGPSRVFRPLDMLDVRSGSRGWALGGAYVANVEGLDAISWNPAGLGWIERPQAAGDMAWTRSSGSVSGFPSQFLLPNSPPLVVKRYDVNLKSRLRSDMLGVARSIEVLGGRKLAGALSYRRYLDTTYPEQIIEDLDLEGGGFPVTIAVDNQERGGVSAAAASGAWELIPDGISVGVNMNFLGGRFHANEETVTATGGPQSAVGSQQLRYSYSGVSADLGLQFRRQGLGRLGVRYTPAYELRVRDGRLVSLALATSGQAVNTLRGHLADYNLKVPPLLSAGGWIELNPKFCVGIEWDQQRWSQAKVEYQEAFPGRELDPKLPLRDVSSIHFGVEGRFVKIGQAQFPLRIGYRGGPLSMAQLSPAAGQPLDTARWPGGDIRANAFTMGLGFESGNIRYDLAYEVIDYGINKFYFDVPVDSLVNPESAIVRVDRRVAQLRLTAALSF